MKTNKELQTPTVVAVDFNESKPPRSVAQLDAGVLDQVKVSLEAVLGAADMTVNQLMALREGAVVRLDAALGATVDIRLNQKVIARAEIVTVDENFGVRITEILSAAATN
ncbi:FliM/FliN family flagellar motor switch protein [Paraherbaspirillum soli]|uniref:Flagellar motor switch protein FliN n=1 Tax=Paraherbaspirillum soli TaxID=631222 RepID=A0ABW0MEX7_9BURK